MSAGGLAAHAVVCAVAFGVALLTLFSGFGLGTLLLPAFALFFPLPVAIAATAVVHLANNLFKLALVGRQADREVVVRFAVPGVLGALAGAQGLVLAADVPPLLTYTVGGRGCEVTLVKLVVAALMVGAAALETLPRFRRLAFDRRWLPVGGLLSGFFGGLSGHQGALRSAFLAKVGLGKEAFVGSGVVAAVLVDLTRLVVYGRSRLVLPAEATSGLVAAATLAAFTGSFLGSRLIEKVTWETIQRLVALLLVVVACVLAAGWV